MNLGQRPDQAIFFVCYSFVFKSEQWLVWYKKTILHLITRRCLMHWRHDRRKEQEGTIILNEIR